MKAILIWATALYLCSTSTLGFAEISRRMTGGFSVGYNEGWFGKNYASSLTSNPLFQTPSSFDIDLIDRTFAGIANGGGAIVKIWLFPALEGVQLTESSPQTLGLTPDFIPNLEKVFSLAKKHGLKVYLAGLNGYDFYQARGPLKTYYADLLSNRHGEREAFKTRALLPILRLMDRGRDAHC
jgi:hypothetical protein